MPDVGKPKCQCIGINNSPGTTVAKISDKEKVEYPAEIGGECKAWDDGKHPSCKGDKPAEWCAKKWCFVDVGSCEVEVPPTPSGYLGDATFQGKKIYFSYATCGEENVYSNTNTIYNHSRYEKER